MIDALIAAERLPASYRAVAEEYWQPLTKTIAASGARIVGINGAQGSGKSTACRFLEPLLAAQGLAAVTLSLDDLYLTRAEREVLARDHHPLFRTRGVPGTHDVALGMTLLDDLLAGRPAALPRFDKASDDRAPELRQIDGRVDVVLFEGWCVGAAPQPAAMLRQPINVLEREEDPDGTWRREVNRRLATDYAELFDRIDLLVMLKVADFSAVKANRARQEARLGAGPAVMDEAALDRFVMHYERLTRWQLAEMPDRADILLEIGADQNPVSAQPALGGALGPGGES
ncbi:kinase [Tsuneonella sp. HG222]